MGGAGRIPWRSIRDYAYDFLFEDAGQLARMMWAMDDVYLRWLDDERKSQNAN